MKPEDVHPYTPTFALLGGDGVVQSGQSEQIGPTKTGGFVPEVDLIQAECPSMYSMMITIVLALRLANPPDTAGEENEIPPLVAVISFGAGGTQTDLEADYIDGAIVSLPAAWLRVKARIDTDDQDIPAVIAGAFVGYYPSGRSREAQRTRRLGVVADAASAIVEVPFFANRIEVHGDVVGSTFTVEQAPDAVAATILSAVSLPAPGQILQTPLVNAARYIRVTNTSGGPRNIRTVFPLAV